MVSSLPCGWAIMRASVRAWARSSGVCCARASRRSASATSTARGARRSPIARSPVARIAVIADPVYRASCPITARAARHRARRRRRNLAHAGHFALGTLFAFVAGRALQFTRAHARRRRTGMITKALSISVGVLALATSALAAGLTERLQADRMTVVQVDRAKATFLCAE